MRTYLLLFIGVILCGCMVTPRPLTMQEIEQRTSTDIEAMFAEQEPVTAPVTLYEAMSRAVKYNLDHRLKLMEAALANRQIDVSRYDLLPKLVTSAGYTHRNNYSGAYSESLIDGSQSLVASTSQDKGILSADISMMWNVLDFGVSYARAHQQADHLLISEERRRKVVQNILQDVCDAYWRAVSAEVLLPEMDELLKRAKTALKRSKQIAEQRLKPPREVLEYELSLLENIRLLWGLIQRLDPAKTELAALMNLRPGTPYQLADADWESADMPSFKNALESLEHLAMTNRPELREEDYRSRITELEARKAILKMLPGIDLNFGYKFDSNDFLYNRNWWNAGVNVSLNIFNLFSGPAAYRAAKAEQETGEIRRLALGMAILTQVNLAYRRYHIAMEEYLISRDMDDVTRRLKEQTVSAAAAGGTDDAEVIRSETNALLAKMRHNLAYSEVRNAAGRIYNSAGADCVPPNAESLDIPSLAQSLKQAFEKWKEEVNGNAS